MTPVLSISGIAGHYAKNASQTFVGVGQVYTDQLQMQAWDGYGINMPAPQTPLHKDSTEAYIGKGLASNLNLCEKLNLEGCVEEQIETNSNPIDEDMNDFLEKEEVTSDAMISLLVASSHWSTKHCQCQNSSSLGKNAEKFR